MSTPGESDRCPVELTLTPEQRAHYDRQVDRYKATINKYYLRKEQKKAFECGADCCERARGTVRDLERCQDECFARPDDQRDYARARFADMHRHFKLCVRRCRKYARRKLKIGKDHPNDVEDEFIACGDFCIEQNTFEMLNGVKELARDLKSKFSIT